MSLSSGGNLNVSGTITCATSLTIGSAAMVEADLEKIDGITDGTAAANKALVLDSNKDIGTIRNLTIEGVFTDGNYIFDTDGNVSALGTVGCGAITSSGALDLNSTANIQGLLTVQTGIVPDAQDGAYLGTSSLQFSDLFLADAAVISFGDDNEITLTHVADNGLILKHAATADDKFPTFTLQTGDTDIAINDKLGVINFQAPDEGAGTDAKLVAAGIEAVSEGDFSASNNATKLSFKTASSAAATETMSLSSTGNLTISGDLRTNNFGFLESNIHTHDTNGNSTKTDNIIQLPKNSVITEITFILTSEWTLDDSGYLHVVVGADNAVVSNIFNTDTFINASNATTLPIAAHTVIGGNSFNQSHNINTTSGDVNYCIRVNASTSRMTPNTSTTVTSTDSTLKIFIRYITYA